MVAHAVVPEVISDDARKVSYWGQKGERTSVVVGALSHSGKACSCKKGAGSARSRKTQNAGVSPFSNWDISPYTDSGSSDMVVDGAL